jgi:thiamine biosynthesis lipoprotein
MGAELLFRAMGSDAHVIIVGAEPGLVDAAVERIRDLEQRWSRFLVDSEVSELNRKAGTFVPVSSETVTLIRRAMEAWHLSGGAFDPTVLGALHRAGYDQPFDQIVQAPPFRVGSKSLLGVGAADIVIRGNSVRLPEATGFDPGGIGKGLAADLVCSELIAAGADGACVNLGGDVRVMGNGPEGGGWTIAVEHAWSPLPIAVLGLAGGAVATSTTLRRRWELNGEPKHHIIDPHTGLPSETDLTLATVVAGDAWVAEVLAKAVLLAGADHPFDIVGGTGAQALVVDDRGAVQSTPGLLEFTGIPTQPEVLAP